MRSTVTTHPFPTHRQPLLQRVRSPFNYAVLIGSAALILALLLVELRQDNPSWRAYAGQTQAIVITPTLTGKPELCLTCHNGIEEISAAHPVQSFGCVSCHGGDGLSLDKDTAHTGLIGGRNPSDLAVVEQGCGGEKCHSGSAADGRDHIARVEHSIQSTYAGAINKVLFSFNQTGANGPYYGLTAVTAAHADLPDTTLALARFDPSAFGLPPIGSFGSTCLTCHLRAASIQQPYFYRSTGCSACHTPYNANGLYTGGDPTIPRDQPGYPAQHRLTTQIPYTQCDTCHNRGNYSLAQMRFVPRADLATHSPTLTSDQLRLVAYYQPIAQFTRCEYELDCVDCHTSKEAMGDGSLHLSQASARSIQCKTCHGTLDSLPTFKTITDPNDVAVRRAKLNPFYDVQVGSVILQTPDGDTQGAVQWVNGQIIQISKVSGKRYVVPPVMGSGCEQKPDEQSSQSCHQCHSVSVPR